MHIGVANIVNCVQPRQGEKAMVKRTLLWSWLVVATALAAGACSDISGDERRGEGAGEKVSIDQLPAPVKAAVEREAAGGQLIDISRDTKRGQTSYEVKIAKDGQESKVRIASDGTKVQAAAAGEDDDDDD